MDTIVYNKHEVVQKRTISKKDHKSLCRFCFNYKKDQFIINIHNSYIAEVTIFQCANELVPITKSMTYWTNAENPDQNGIVKENCPQLFRDMNFMTGACNDCVKVIFEFTAFVNRMRSSEEEIQELRTVLSMPNGSIKSMALKMPRRQFEIDTMNKQCILKSNIGNNLLNADDFFKPPTFFLCLKSFISNVKTNLLKLVTFGLWKEAIDPKTIVTIEYNNLENLCRYCYESNTEMLFDIFSSNICNEPLINIIKSYCSNYSYHPSENSHNQYFNTTTTIVVRKKVELMETTSIKNICVFCLKKIIEMQILADRIRATNSALKLWQSLSKKNDEMEVGFSSQVASRSAFINILEKSQLVTCNKIIWAFPHYFYDSAYNN